MIIITGASGLLGSNLVWAAKNRSSDILALYHQHPARFPDVPSVSVNLADPQAVTDLIQRMRPQWIIHCAALTDLDACEKNPDLAYSANVLASANLAEALAKTGGRLVYVSTDAVYSGKQGAYHEEDETDPVNEYARSKREGERCVLKHLPNALIVRTNLYGWNARSKSSLAEWILQRLEQGQRVPGWRDVWFSPILANDLCDVILELIERDATGVYHAAGSEACSKYAFAKKLAETFGFDPECIDCTSIQDAGLQTPRPLDTSMQTEKIAMFLNRPMPDMKAGLQRFRELRESGFTATLKQCGGE